MLSTLYFCFPIEPAIQHPVSVRICCEFPVNARCKDSRHVDGNQSCLVGAIPNILFLRDYPCLPAKLKA